MKILIVSHVGVQLLLALLADPVALAQRAGDEIDASQDFVQRDSVYFVPDRIVEFNAASGIGSVEWDRYSLASNLSFNKVDAAFVRARSNEFPASEYDRDPTLPFSISFLSTQTVRLRLGARSNPHKPRDSLMLAGPLPNDDSWKITETRDAVVYTSPAGQVRIQKDPWRIEFYDASGQLLTRTRTLKDPETFSCPTPFSFVRRDRDLGYSTAASFQLAYDEKIFGCGESFTRFNKRGQRICLYARDGMGVQSQRMYKPIPFFLSSRGYGMFIHTSAPATCDIGRDFDGANVIYTGDEELDLFIFLGAPKKILTEYTAVTGRSPVPPLWSFGLWMSRITYKSETEVRQVAARLRKEKIPSDVIHLDTGWFETDWQCNYEFAPSRFDDPEKMIADLKKDGFHISLWQLPYFTSKNELYKTIVDNGYHVRNEGGEQPYLDAILDFSNTKSVEWHQGLIANLLNQGVAAIKVDFGEDAPLRGVYASGRTGWYEHNLYPLRYNKAVADVTREVTGENIIWARSAWAGSQRYPVHWGGDAENTDSAMAATLRAGLSLGLCGFSFWSHDVGGFVGRPSAELYRRWLAFGVLTSHTRCHGAPPREPWEYGEEFQDDFRRAVELKYALMPYIYAQAKECSENGHPMIRPLFFEFPDDAASWLVEDEYCFGSDLLVAPLFSKSNERNVYLPPGRWIDYQSGESYDGGRWCKIAAGRVPLVLLAKAGAAIPHLAVAQATAKMDWKTIELRLFGAQEDSASTCVALPGTDRQKVVLERVGDVWRVKSDPLRGEVTWQIRHVGVELLESQSASTR